MGHLVARGSQDHVTGVPLTFCYAVGGARVDNVRRQIRQLFLGEEESIDPVQPAGQKPDFAPWIADDSLCCTSVPLIQRWRKR